MKKRLVWYVQVERRDNDHDLKQVVDMPFPGGRRRGRPKTRWKDWVNRDLRELCQHPPMLRIGQYGEGF